MRLMIITGLSGAGKSCVADAFEDIGWFCVENIPVKLICDLSQKLMNECNHEKVAIVTDMRAGICVQELKKSVEQIKKSGVFVETLFVDCKKDVLFTRYKQSRRLHPLMRMETDSLAQSIEKEASVMKEIKLFSDYIIDTTLFSSLSTKQRILSTFSENTDRTMHIHCMSFGFKHGTPEDVDYMFDTRFLPNPYYIDELRNLTGLDSRVSSFVLDNEAAAEFKNHLINMVDFVVPECIKEGRSQLVIAIGCTGGHHRSVTFVGVLSEHLRNKGYRVSVSHREIEK